jgi:arabinofuranosyltransferase
MKTRNIFLTVFCTLFVIYGALFIQNSSLKFGEKRYFLLFDDAMISMCYAKNMAEGNGLTWARGADKTEGYSNFLWTIYMAVPHLMGYDISKTSLFIQLSALLFLLLTFFLIYEIAFMVSDGSNLAAAGAVFLCGGYFTYTFWSLAGMEVSILGLLVTLTVYLYFLSLKKGVFESWIYWIYMACVLIRFDMIFYIVFAGALMAMGQREHAKKHLLYTALSVAIPGAAMTLFRLLYYKDILPNTYYLKMTGYPLLLRIGRGLWSFIGMIMRVQALPFILPLAGLFLIKDFRFRLLFALFAVQSLYSIYVGGDAWHNEYGANRFISVTIPLFFIALSVTVYKISSLIKAHTLIKQSGAVITLLLCVILLNSYNGSRSLRQLALMEPATDTELGKARFYDAYFINSLTDGDAVGGVYMSGVVPYFAPGRYVDFLGKNDRYIASLPMQQPPQEAPWLAKISFFYPGHMKTDYRYAILERRPDIFFLTEKRSNRIVETAGGMYTQYTNGMFLRKGSKHIRWEALEEMKRAFKGALKEVKTP